MDIELRRKITNKITAKKQSNKLKVFSNNDVDEMSQEDLVDYVINKKFHTYEMYKIAKLLTEESLKKILEHDDTSDSIKNSILDKIDDKIYTDLPYWRKFVSDRIQNHNADELGRHPFRAIHEPEMIKEFLMHNKDSDWMYYDSLDNLDTETAVDIIKKGKHREGIAGLLTRNKDYNVLKEFIIDRQNEKEFIDILFTWYMNKIFEIYNEKELYDLLDITNNDTIRNSIIKSVDNIEYLKNFVDNYKGHIESIRSTIKKLIKGLDDPDFFKSLVNKNKEVLKSNPDILHKFEDEDLFKSILTDENTSTRLKKNAAMNIHDDDFIMDYFDNTDTAKIDVSEELIENIEDPALLQKLLDDKNLKRLVIPRLKDTDLLKKIINDNNYSVREVQEAFRTYWNESDSKEINDFAFDIIKKNEHHPDIQREVFRAVKDEKNLRQLAQNEGVLYDIRREILEDDDDLAEELDIDPENFENEQLKEKYFDDDIDDDEKILIINSLDDDDDIIDIFSKESVGSTPFKYIISNFMGNNVEEYLEPLIRGKNKDALLEIIVEYDGDIDDLKVIVEDDLLSDWDYYERSSIADEIMIQDNYNDQNFIHTVLEKGYGGDDGHELVDYITDQGILESIARDHYISDFVSVQALRNIVDEGLLKEAMDWGSEYVDAAYYGIKDGVFLKDWVLNGGNVESESDFMDHLAELDDTNKLVEEVYLYAVSEENDDWIEPSLSHLKNQNLLEDAINSESDIARNASLKNITDEKIIVDKASNDPSFRVRKTAVSKLKGNKHQDLLKQIATNDDNPYVREEAVGNITDDEFLKKIVFEDEDSYVTRKALQKINADKNPDFFKDLYANSNSIGMKQEAIRNLPSKGNQEFFKEIVFENEDFSEKALSKIEDEDILLEISLNKDVYNSIRTRAIKKIDDQEILVKLANELENDDLKKLAVIKLEGENLKEEWFDIWAAYYTRYNEPSRIKHTAKVKILDWLEAKGMTQLADRILKTIPYRHLPESRRPEKRDLSFEKPELKVEA